MRGGVNRPNLGTDSIFQHISFYTAVIGLGMLVDMQSPGWALIAEPWGGGGGNGRR